MQLTEPSAALSEDSAFEAAPVEPRVQPAFTAGIGHLAKLTTLLLHDNKLTALPESFGMLTALTELNLSNNPLCAPCV